MGNSLKAITGPDVSLKTKVIFASALVGLGFLLGDESVKDKTGSNGFNMLGGTAGLIDRAAADKKTTSQHPPIPKDMENMADFGNSAY